VPDKEKKLPIFDAAGWYGPFLLLKVKCFLDQLAPGESALVSGQGEMDGFEMRALLKATGFQLVESRACDGGQVLVIRRRADASGASRQTSGFNGSYSREI
jgi:hypothetical protein